MKATYVNPPFRNESIPQIEDAFLRAVIRHAGGEDKLKAIMLGEHFHDAKSLAMLKAMAKQSVIFQLGLLSEHNGAYFDLKAD